MTAVFISHSNTEADRREASTLRDALMKAGYENVFLDLTNLRAMQDWESQLYQELAIADVVAFLHSATSASSAWCHREIGIARFRHRPVLVVPVEPLDPFGGLGMLQQLPFIADGDQRYAETLAALARSGYGPETSFHWDIEASPYPGLAPFEAEQAAVFFGRDQDVRDLEGYLDPTRSDGAVVLVAGASGAGKSSLIRAGLLPRLKRRAEWEVMGVLEPGPNFQAQLARLLAGLEQRNVESPRVPILVMDQAERLLVSGDPSVPGIPALEDLTRALSGSHGLHVIVVTKTVDSRLTAAIGDWLVARYLVVGLNRTQLARVVAEPATRAGLTVDPAVVSRLVEATPSGDALPLLALTLAEMWRRRSDAFSLTLDDYERVGGVTRILNDVTQSVLGTLPLVPLDEIVSTMLAFVSVDHRGRVISVPRPLEFFTGTRRQIVQAFADRRLLTIKDDTEVDAGRTVALAHDALMSSWGSLATAIEREREQLVLENDVRREALRGEGDWTLLTGPRLDAALSRFHDREVEEPIVRYLTACKKARADAVAARERATRLTVQRRRRTVLAVAALSIALVAVAGIFVLQRQNTQIAALEQAAHAVSLSQSRRDLALKEALEAIQGSANPATYSALLQVLTDQPGPRRYLTASDSPVYDVASTQSALLIGSDAGPERVDDQTGERTLVSAGSGQASAVAASQDGSVIVAVNDTRLVVVTAEGTRLVADMQPSLLPMVAMDRRGSRIAVADSSPAVKVFDGRGQPMTSPVIDRVPADLAMSADGRKLAVVDLTGELTTVDLDSGAKTVIEAVSSQLARVAMSADGNTVITVSSTGVVERMTSARPRGEVLKTPGLASAIAFLNGSVLAVGHQDGSLALLDSVTGNQLATFGSHQSAVVSIAGTSDRLVSVDKRGEVVIWDGPASVPLLGAVVGQGFRVADVGEDGRVVAVGANDGRVTEWPADGRPRVSGPLDEALTAVAAGTAGQLAVGTAAGFVLTLDPDLRPGAALAVSTGPVVALDWVGDRLAAGTAAGEIVVLRGGQVETRERVVTEGAVTVLRALPNGDLAWGTSAGVVGTWSLNGDRRVRVLGAAHGGLFVSALNYGESGKTLYSGGDDRQVLTWQLGDTGTVRPAAVGSYDDAIVGLAQLSGSGESWLATASQDRFVRIWDLKDGGTAIGPPIAAPGGARFTWAANSSEGRFLTLDTFDRIIAWDVSPAGLVRTACATLLPERSGGAKPSSCAP
jgi:WD40 repeat protein